MRAVMAQTVPVAGAFGVARPISTVIVSSAILPSTFATETGCGLSGRSLDNTCQESYCPTCTCAMPNGEPCAAPQSEATPALGVMPTSGAMLAVGEACAVGVEDG